MPNLTEPLEHCVWHEHEDEDGLWETACDGVFEFNYGGPADNDFKFCPYCGHTITIGVTIDD